VRAKRLGLSGPPCPRCKRATEVREHRVIGEKQLRAPFYYSRWYRCTNAECPTTLIMPNEFRVYPENREIWGETWDAASRCGNIGP
jgi:hypothetical protein